MKTEVYTLVMDHPDDAIAELESLRAQLAQLRAAYNTATMEREAAIRREDSLAAQLAEAERERETLIATLQSIARNTCCGSCNEAALVARAALERQP